MVKNDKSKTSLVKKWLYTGLILVFVLSMTYWKNYLRSLPQDYTVGEVTQTYLPAKGRRKAVFKYSVSGKGYSREILVDKFSSEPEAGARFIVEYPERFNGKFGVLRPDIPVENKVEIPSEGWDELPEGFKVKVNNRD